MHTRGHGWGRGGLNESTHGGSCVGKRHTPPCNNSYRDPVVSRSPWGDSPNHTPPRPYIRPAPYEGFLPQKQPNKGDVFLFSMDAGLSKVYLRPGMPAYRTCSCFRGCRPTERFYGAMGCCPPPTPPLPTPLNATHNPTNWPGIVNCRWPHRRDFHTISKKTVRPVGPPRVRSHHPDDVTVQSGHGHIIRMM